MIYGVGTDIAQCSRFSTWVDDENKCRRFFNNHELPESTWSIQHKIEHLASRFAAKEAFVKALGTGFAGFEFKDIYVSKDADGKPEIIVENTAKNFMDTRLGNKNANIQLSISHEKDYAVAFVVIEI